MNEVVLVVYIIILSFLVAFSFRAFWLYYLYRKHRGSWRTRTPEQLDEWPRVCVQLPMYNEYTVAERIIRAAAALDYPRDKLEIQVLDDSDDETVDLVRKVVSELAAGGLNIRLVHRGSREGYKAGALKHGLSLSDAELFAVFDADFLPPRDFLRKTVPHFQDPDIGAVQTRWGYANDLSSPLAMLQAVVLDGHFVVEQFVRNREGLFMIFNGTGGIWRAKAIRDAGGWESDTITEDADLSYRAQLAGYRILYLPDVVCPSELPLDVNALKSQQRRWTKGGVQTMRKILPRVMSAKLPFKVKLEAFFHLSGNLAYPAMLVLACLTLPVLLIKTFSDSYNWYFALAGCFIVGAFGFPLLYITALRDVYPDWTKRAWFVPFMMSLAMGISLNNAAAAMEGLFKNGGVFARTPKWGTSNAGLYKLAERRSQAICEIILGIYMLATYIYCIIMTQLILVPFVGLYAIGFLTTGFHSYLSTRQAEALVRDGLRVIHQTGEKR
ncbi:MAG: glycosyltransferase [candidate division WOR-3 bacterium]